MSPVPAAASQGLPAQDQSPAPVPATGLQVPLASGSLEQALGLRDIRPPAEPAFWPPAPGWWVLLALLAASLVAAGARAWRAHRVRARRRRILAALDGISHQVQGPALAAEVSALLKRVALARFPRGEVAPLTGPAWLAFLDRHGGAGRFTAGPGRVLAEGPYARALDLDPQALLDLAGDWVRKNT